MTKYEMQNILTDYDIVTEETMNVVVKMCGDRPGTYEDLLYVITGYRTFESYLDAFYDKNYDRRTEVIDGRLCYVVETKECVL